jgi:hypothetical protein
MIEILESQKAEANSQFGKFIERNYEDWFYQKQTNCAISYFIQRISRSWNRKKDKPILFVVIDNLRYVENLWKWSI